MKVFKRIFSCVCVLSMLLSSFAVVANAAVLDSDTLGAKIKVTVEHTTDANANGKIDIDDVITVKYSYEDFNDITYNDDEGAGKKMTNIAFHGKIPGLTSDNATGYFKKAGAYTKLVPHNPTGSPNYSVTASGDADFIVNIIFADETDCPMTTSGDLYSVKIKVKKEIDQDLVFGFDETYNYMYQTYDYADWGQLVENCWKNKNITFVPYTLPAQVEKPDPDPQPETVNYTPVADVDGLSAEFLAKYPGKYMFKSDIIGMTGATTESTVKITRGEVSKNTITLGAALGLTGGADVTAEKIVVAVITSEASGEAFTFEIE